MRNTHRFTFLLLFLLAAACQNDRSPSSANPAPSVALPEVAASVEAVKSLGENEFFFKERLSSISADGDSAFWLGSEAGDLWNIKGRAMQNYNLGVDRIYKVMTDSTSGRIWVGARNGGLQCWERTKGTMQLRRTYAIAAKGTRYSPYDLLRVDRQIFVATSNGLFVLPPDGEALRKLYPTDANAPEDAPCLISKLAPGTSPHHLFAASPQGLLHIDTRHHRISRRHVGQDVHDVSLHDGRLYVLSGQTLYVEEEDGTVRDSVQFDFRPIAHCKMGRTHFLLLSHAIVLSEDLRRFATFPLRRRIPHRCHNIVLPDPTSGYVALVTENALWQVPAHTGIFNGNTPTLLTCTDGNAVYYLQSDNALYRQSLGREKATKIYNFPANEHISKMDVVGQTLYYTNSQMEVKSLRLQGGYLRNELFASPRLRYASKANILSSTVIPAEREATICIGVQDGLIRIDAEGKADTLPELWGKYITAFYTPSGGNPLYVATLNDGVYSAHNGRCEPIPATQSLCFIRDLTLTNGYPPNLVALTNRRLVGLQSADTLAAKGCYRVVNIGDSLLYAFPEYGIYRYTFKDGHLQAAGVFFSDIRFHPNAVSVVGNRLYLGTAIGAMTFEAGRESAAEWIAFNSDVVSGKWVLMGGVLVLIFLGLAVFIYRKQRQQYRRQIQVHIHDLSQRLAALVRMSALLTPEEDTEVKRLQSQLQQVPTGIGAANQFIQALSTQIMRRNQDLALQLSKLLARQIRQLESSEAFDAQHLLEASLQTQAADDVEAIGQQVLCNESWLHRMEALHTLLHQCRSLTQGVAVVEGVNEGLEAQCAHLQSGLAKCSLDLLAPDITALQQAYDSVHSEAARTGLRHRLEATHQRAAEGVDFDKTTAAIAARVSRLMETLHETPPAVTLQVLYELELHLLQIDLLVQLRQNMLTYTRLRNEIVHENQQRVHHKFDAKLDAEIAERTQPITAKIDSLVTAFYRTFEQTDAFVLKELLHFTHYDGQQARVLALLLAHPKVKRLFLAGMLGIYGNLNPVMSRLINGKLKPNDAALAAYVATHPMSIVTYVRLLSE